MFTVNDYNRAYAKQHQSHAELLYQNAREAVDDISFTEAEQWQVLAAKSSLAARVYLGITEKDYEYEHLSP